MSASGAFFWVHGGVFTPGDRIYFVVQIHRALGRMRLICRGDIVRTEPHNAVLGVAVTIRESEIEPLPPRLTIVKCQ